MRVAQEIQLSVRMQAIAHPQSPVSDYVTLSIGVSCTIPWYKGSPETLIATADRALYQAKQSGRDRAIFVPLSNPGNPDTKK
jgi:diguanylate cyclase (GGDEF)-like protein